MYVFFPPFPHAPPSSSFMLTFHSESYIVFRVLQSLPATEQKHVFHYSLLLFSYLFLFFIHMNPKGLKPFLETVGKIYCGSSSPIFLYDLVLYLVTLCILKIKK